jgi:hypothetical protein
MERKFVLTKIAPGDYLLPSNDGKTIWRIALYTEGPSSGVEDWPRDKEVWGLWRWRFPVEATQQVDVDDWDGWEFFEGPHMKRGEAIDSALKMGAAPPGQPRVDSRDTGQILADAFAKNQDLGGPASR